MTKSELINLLKDLPDDREIDFKPSMSSYGEDISDNVKRRMITSMWGNDFEAYVICSDGQTGSI